jgi:hypothetical protein
MHLYIIHECVYILPYTYCHIHIVIYILRRIHIREETSDWRGAAPAAKGAPDADAIYTLSYIHIHTHTHIHIHIHIFNIYLIYNKGIKNESAFWE